MFRHDTVVILDFGAINAQRVAKMIRSLKIYCEVLPCTASPKRIRALKPKALVYQRGPDCGDQTLGREPDQAVRAMNLPVFDLAQTPATPTRLKKFLVGQCGLQQDWTPERFVDETVAALRKQIGRKQALLAMSGGVDSSICAVLTHRAVGSQLTCVFVDHGCMRQDEPRQVCEVFRDIFGVKLIHVDASSRFLRLLKGVKDPERKRKIIGEAFIRVFEEEASKLGDLDFFVQGTIYPDIIESGLEGGKAVKAHHNVGGLPERIGFKGIVEPVRCLFKDEVRQVGRALGIPDTITQRQPFPGPGLAVRCLGEVTREKLNILREADALFRQSMADAGWDREANQYFAVLAGDRSVGVADHARTYGHTIALRAVRTTDFMTAEFVKIPMDILEAVSRRITEALPQVNRVVYDITHKPPATIEWE